jgi:hypothetical protein
MKRTKATRRRYGVFKHKVVRRFYLQFGHWVLWLVSDRRK